MSEDEGETCFLCGIEDIRKPKWLIISKFSPQEGGTQVVNGIVGNSFSKEFPFGSDCIKRRKEACLKKARESFNLEWNERK